MAGRIANTVYYAENPQLLANFWAAVLDYRIGSRDGRFEDRMRAGGMDEATIASRILVSNPDGGAGLVFRHTPAPRVGRNRVHFDVQATPGRRPTDEELDAARDELVALGATVVRLVDQDWGPFHEHYYQMQDPEGNEFCLQ